MTLAGIDLDSTRARAVIAAERQPLALAPLDEGDVELPLCISLAEKTPRVGRAGLKLVRHRPHLVCANFLDALGDPRIWAGPRCRIDAEQATALLCESLARALPRNKGVALSLPAYLDDGQVGRIYQAAQRARLSVLGSVPSPLALALAAKIEVGTLALVVELDEHALVWSVVERTARGLQVRLAQPSTVLARSAWLLALLGHAADRAVWQCRRDPRESGEAEQSLYEQLVTTLFHAPLAGSLQLQVQGPNWYHHLTIPGDDLTHYVAPLLRQAVNELDALLPVFGAAGWCVLVSHSAARLPGLLAVIKHRLPPPDPPRDEEDFGDSLVAREGVPLHVLSPDEPGITTHGLALRFLRGELPPGHLEELPLAGQPGAQLAQEHTAEGPPRLSFRGREHVLQQTAFVLGRDPTCDLVFESALYPHVSGQHCEILFDRRSYVLRDRSRYGTLINEHPVRDRALLSAGDWIRLGPQGPVLRFLGETLPPQKSQ